MTPAPSPIEIIGDMQRGLAEATPRLPTSQALSDLQEMMRRGEQNTPENRAALQRLLEHNLLQLDHTTLLHESHRETNNALRGLRNTIGMPLSNVNTAPPQPEFVQRGVPITAESMNTGLRRPVLGGILAAGAGAIALSYLWNLVSHPGQTIGRTAQTAFTGLLAAGVAVGGYFTFRNVQWGEVGSTFTGLGSSAAGFVPNAAAFTLLALPVSMVPTSWRQWALARTGPEAVKKGQEDDKNRNDAEKQRAEIQRDVGGLIKRAQALNRGASILSSLAGRQRIGGLDVQTDAQDIRVNGRRLLIDVGLTSSTRLNLASTKRCLVLASWIPPMAGGEGIEAEEVGAPANKHQVNFTVLQETLTNALAAFALDQNLYSTLGVTMRLE